MKNIATVSLFMLAFHLCGNAQTSDSTLFKDPLKSFKWVHNISAQIGVSHTTKNFDYLTNSGKTIHQVNTWNYAPNIDGHFQIGRLFHDEVGITWQLATGLNVLSNSVVMTDSNREEFSYQNLSLAVPLTIGMRLPLHSSLQKGDFYKCFDLNTGLYLGVPIIEYRDDQSNLFDVNYLTLGLIGEITFSALNEFGRGYKFGLRARTDLNAFEVGNNTGQYPSQYHSVGVVWYMINNYK